MSFLIFCIIPSITSYIYAVFYCKMRNVPLMDPGLKTIIKRLLFCLIFDYFLMFLTKHIPENSYILLLLLEILSGIDIFIHKIPTELLSAAGIFAVVRCIESPVSVFSLFSVLLIGLAFCVFQKKTGIGTYDILLIIILGVMLLYTALQVKFIAVLLILWGAAGVAAGVLKNRRDLSIPLVPLISFSYYAVQILL